MTNNTPISTSMLTLQPNGGTVLIYMEIKADFEIQSASIKSMDTAVTRSWVWSLYIKDDLLNNQIHLKRVAQSNGHDVFTASAPSIRILNVKESELTLAPGLYILAIQNDHMINTLTIEMSEIEAPIDDLPMRKWASPLDSQLDIDDQWKTFQALVHVLLRAKPSSNDDHHQ